jgi:aminopeptidase N
MVSYNFSYLNKLKNDLTFGISSKMLDGFDRHAMTLSGLYFGDQYSVETVFAQRRNADYMWNKAFVNSGWDNRVNLDYKHRYYYMGGNGNIKFGVGSSLPGSSYNYSEISLEVLNSTYVGKAIFKTRTYAVLMDGNNIAPESMVMLAGANNRDLMDNKYTRSRGWVPDEWSEYLRGGNHFHYGGGLNLRGYSGYLATNNNETDTFSLFAGTKGVSLNAELGIGQWLTPKLGKLKKNLAVDPYVFGDAGILGNSKNQYSDLRVDAGIGAAFSFSLPKYNKTKPLIIRLDVPLFLNRVAEEEGEYVAFRYLIGLNKAF